MKITLKLLSTILLITLSCAAAPAQSKKPTPDPKKLIGLEIVDGKYPDGWVWDGVRSGGVGSTHYVLQLKNKNKKQHAFVFIKAQRPITTTDKISGNVTDAIQVVKPDEYHDYSWRCYYEKDKEAVAQERFKNWINANVKFKNYCDMTTMNIKKAWKFHTDIGKFELVKDTKGLICEFGFGAKAYKEGVPETRENCPSSNWYPDTLYKK
jgi:hypothetical protein